MQNAGYMPATFHDAAGCLTLLTRSTLAPKGSINIGCAAYPMLKVDVSSSTHRAYARRGPVVHTRRLR
ncbi:50S ribosomal protein L31 type B [Candidatus Tremblaya princeps]|jgi:ribosomal protein L31|uniref:50S ribosomal protein L31 type B n=1 Tax=Tremblaya princeps TaxID=189385 RepID=A0A143WP90_TREPR|nr:50S ribosomal protein L31 type B [Candidatus Tremblaya princeps]